jgi:hypothetical protein
MTVCVALCVAAGLVAGLPSKQGIPEAVLGAAQATVELLLAEHKREEQGHWEVSVSPTELSTSSFQLSPKRHCVTKHHQCAALMSSTVLKGAVACRQTMVRQHYNQSPHTVRSHVVWQVFSFDQVARAPNVTSSPVWLCLSLLPRLQVWLAEFTRLMEQRPTSSQLQQQLAKQQQQCEQQALAACKQTAASAAETAAARAVAAAMEGEGFSAQLRVLDMRVETLEEGMQRSGSSTAECHGAVAPVAPAVYAAHCASQGVSAAGVLPASASATSAALGAAMTAQGSAQLAVLMRQVGDVQLKLLGKADTVELEQQLLQLRHALQDAMQGAVARDEFEARLSRKLDVDTFLASVAARQQAARQRKQAKHPQRVDDIEL